MRIAIWLYLKLLSLLPDGNATVSVAPTELAARMGLKEGTIRSWLGHLRKAGYLSVTASQTGLDITIHRLRDLPSPKPVRFFTPAKVEQALGETGYRAALEVALEAHADVVLRRALAGAMALPAEQIKKSRTAVFLYLAKRYANES
jgi:hypothetical protein